ncbi:MAG: DNA repair protein RecN [Chloroflexi bacterium]|nr:DNA repair protein RecN [Chloroflexota bacterium]
MISELIIKNLAIIDTMNVSFKPGFNVLTGETGAGKSIIIDAISLLLGGRADTVLIRAGCDKAIVEGVFIIEQSVQNEIAGLLLKEGLDDSDTARHITLGRELRRGGRNICRINGRTVNLALLRDIGSLLVDVHGQSEHLSLLRVSEHLSLLDRFGGLNKQRKELSKVIEEITFIRRKLAELRNVEMEKLQRVDLLSFQVKEISMAALVPGEELELRSERTKLANVENLAEITDKILAVSGYDGNESDQNIASESLGEIAELCHRLARIDPTMHNVKTEAESLVDQLQEFVSEVLVYKDGIEFDPVRLDEVEDRLHLIQDLQRKYGSDVEDIIAYGDRAQSELDDIAGNTQTIEDLETSERSLMKEAGQLAVSLSKSRQEVGEILSTGVMMVMAELNMDGSKFAVQIDWKDDPRGLPVSDGRTVAMNTTGIDQVEFLIAPNKGEGLKPIVKIASGGETSRLMLALRSMLATADRKPTLIFDEIDQGIGGRIGAIIGKQLWSLSQTHQVLCITHLPPLAGYGDAHFKVQKEVKGERTRTTVHHLDGNSRVEEIVDMLGGQDESVRETALSLLSMASNDKNVGAAS